ncbi:hypoxanthine phosphoribosyltransferase [Oscillospiraceae bacterium CM]|nr:hypoxanthine phosphoribosyltransferase [Oscillospiraceae bacterium CM]
MKNDIEKVFFTADAIAKRVCELGAQITTDYTAEPPLLVGILKGSFVFMADLARAIDLYCDVDFIAASSYGNATETSGIVTLTKPLSADAAGRHLLIAEDILDTGVTLTFLRSYLLSLKPASVKICALLDKPSRRKAPISADYVGFTCPDAFYVGYGLDYAEHYRNLPYIGSLKPEIYE